MGDEPSLAGQTVSHLVVGHPRGVGPGSVRRRDERDDAAAGAACRLDDRRHLARRYALREDDDDVPALDEARREREVGGRERIERVAHAALSVAGAG